jgi:hypothetical protein
MKEKDEFTEGLEAMQAKTIYWKLSKVKSEIGALSKNAKNPFFKSDYLDLNGILSAVEPLLEKWGLVLVQPIVGGSVESIIIDLEGEEEIKSTMPLPSITDPQKLGSAITYFRRYTLQSLLALQAVDDDGNTATQAKQSLNAKQFETIKTALDSGTATYTKEKIVASYKLTPEQIKALG